MSALISLKEHLLKGSIPFRMESVMSQIQKSSIVVDEILNRCRKLLAHCFVQITLLVLGCWCACPFPNSLSFTYF
jgi:L-fucose isomerase-like protein